MAQIAVLVRKLILVGLVLPRVAFGANDSAQTFTLDGQLFHANSNNVLLDGAAKLTVQILDPSETCVLYEES